MARAALLVVSSRWESLPTVLIEALYGGLRLVVTDFPSGQQEIPRRGRLGRPVPAREPEALAETVSRRYLDFLLLGRASASRGAAFS